MSSSNTKGDTMYPKFFKKAVKGNVGGYMLDKRGNVDEFLLKGDPKNPNADPDAMVVEIYDADGEKYFIKKNKEAIKNGYLMEINDYELTLDVVNSVTDGDLKDILKLSQTAMKKRIEEFTSSVPLFRLLDIANAENKPVKTVAMIKSAIDRLDSTVDIRTITSGDTTVRGI